MRKLLMVAVCTLLAGCAGDIAGPASGAYTLFAVNGSRVPYALPDASPYATLFSGTLVIESREWTQTLVYGGRPAGLMTAIRTGRIRTDSPNRYRFTSPAGTLLVDGRGEVLEFETGGATYAYRRSR